MFNIGKMTQAYMVAALWTEMPQETGRVVTADAFSPEAVTAMQADCQAFVDKLVEDQMDKLAFRSWTSAELGHDLWLTRNGHGVGFWDRGLGPVGDRLADLARGMGEATVELGDDNQVHYRA
jgi:hypothetical protein